MTRIESLAETNGQLTYKGTPGYKFLSAFGNRGKTIAHNLSLIHNQHFIERMMKWGVKIVDYGIDVFRDGRSFYYLMETIVSNGYWNLFIVG